MGAGQIGGIATLLDIDFQNAAGFIGQPAKNNEIEFVVYYMSSVMLFCTGALLESHVAVTPASCVHNENYKFSVYGGTHKFKETRGTSRLVTDICFHMDYNQTSWYQSCTTNNIALLVFEKEYSFRDTHTGADYVMNGIWYGTSSHDIKAHLGAELINKNKCYSYGWGSRRNGFLIPTLIHLQKFELKLQPPSACDPIWNYNQRYLCFQQPACLNLEYGALCPDDFGSVVICNDALFGMMVARPIDRPCGIGYLDMSVYKNFLYCGVEASRSVYQSTLSHMVGTTQMQGLLRMSTEFTEHFNVSEGTIESENTTPPTPGVETGRPSKEPEVTEESAPTKATTKESTQEEET